MVHDLFVAGAGDVGLGDEARAQTMRAQPLAGCDLQAGNAGPLGEDEAHRVGVQRPPPDHAPLVDAAEHRPIAAVGGAQPGFQRTHRAGVGPLAAGNAQAGALAGLIPLGARDQQPEPFGGKGDVLALDGNQLRAAQRASVAQEQQRAVALSGQGVAACLDQAAQLVGG